MEHYYAVAIDGPSGAGKSTLARALAKELGFVYVDTGAIYRSVGYFAFQRGIEAGDSGAVEALLPEIHLEMVYGEDGLQHMILNGKDVTKEIRLPEISMYASKVSAIPAVRAFLLAALYIATHEEIYREEAMEYFSAQGKMSEAQRVLVGVMEKE